MVQLIDQDEIVNMVKPFVISKQLVVKAYQLVKQNAGTAGIDGESIWDFEKDLKRNLYKIWNRMSSGSYFPPPVMAMPIPKKSGGKRILGIPTVADRIAQMVVKLEIESEIEPHFLPDSYGYRPNKSALDAIKVTRERCWKYDWILEFDIKGLFDNIPHELLIKALFKHIDCKWALLYIERWLKVPMCSLDDEEIARNKGVPQGGVISPILSNLFMHYAFDRWISNKYSGLKWCRYADDGLVHCSSEIEAVKLLEELSKRFLECGIEMHSDKTKIVYCKDRKRNLKHANNSFEFLGYEFRPRVVMNHRDHKKFLGYTAAVSKHSVKSMRDKTRSCKWHQRSDLEIEDISKQFEPVLRGWLNYYGKYCRSELNAVFCHFNQILVKWARRKYKRFLNHKIKAHIFIQNTAKKNPHLFSHWRLGIIGTVV